MQKSIILANCRVCMLQLDVFYQKAKEIITSKSHVKKAHVLTNNI